MDNNLHKTEHKRLLSHLHAAQCYLVVDLRCSEARGVLAHNETVHLQHNRQYGRRYDRQYSRRYSSHATMQHGRQYSRHYNIATSSS